MSLDEHLRRQFNNEEPIICPECRNTVIRRINEDELSLPPAMTCSVCAKYIARIVRFPCCGLQNEEKCLRCEVGEDTGTVTCPRCSVPWSACDLQTLTLCIFCKKLKIERKPVCECQGIYANRDHSELISFLTRMQDHRNQFRIVIRQQQQNVPVVTQLRASNQPRIIITRPHAPRIVLPEPSRQDVRESKSGKYVLLVILFVAVVLYALYASGPGSTKSRHGGAKRNTRSSYRTQSGTRNNEKPQQRKPERVKTKVPIYQKDCYPRAVWIITSGGEVHTKICEDVLTGYKVEYR